MKSNLTISLFGNPNCGKTAVFNLLTGLNQKVSNYPGITVEKKIANFKYDNLNISIEDYPGAYSLTPQSLDEKIVFEALIGWLNPEAKKPDAIVYVADVTNLRRNLYFLSQILTFEIPVILLLNMSDLVDTDKIVDYKLLKENFSLYDVILFSAAKETGYNKLLNCLKKVSKEKPSVNHSLLQLSEENMNLIAPLKDCFSNYYNITDNQLNQLSFSALCNDKFINNLSLHKDTVDTLKDVKNNILSKIDDSMKSFIPSMESDIRYGFIDDILQASKYQPKKKVQEITISEKIDSILTHQWFGPLIYVGILYFIFQSIFTWATIPMDYIDAGITSIGDFVYNIMPDSWFRDLIVEGIIGGVGAVVIFLPQILLLMFFMILLEDTGYMTRITFLMDKFMRKMGLHGKSILPIMSGYACAIPGIISTRTIDSWKERLITILILPLVSCAARLPVYVLMIGAFIPDIYVFNFIGLQGLMMVVMYFLGTVTAFILAKVFSKVLSERSNPTFIMELPPYRKPIAKSVFKQVVNRGKLFLIDAGKIIMAISIVLWVLVSFPKNDIGKSEISQSYAGRIGHFIEPVIQPLGFDWKIGIGLLTSFAAREVVVSTLATIYNVQEDGDSMVNLKDAMKNDIDPRTGRNVYNPIVAVSLMVFYVFAAQCMATFAVVKTETNTWKWPLLMIGYMTFLAYVMSLLVYQVGKYIFII